MAGASPCGGAPVMDASTGGGASMVDACLSLKKKFKKKEASTKDAPFF